MRALKCNSDGASKGNLGPSSGAFCIRSDTRNLVYAEAIRLEEDTNLVARN